MKIECAVSGRQAQPVHKCTNPELHLSEIPKETVSLVIIAENPDTLRFHWIVYNIPVTGIIKENFDRGINAVNDFGQHDFISPDPYSENVEAHLVFSVFALNVILNIGGGKGGDDILKVMQGHILDRALVECYYTLSTCDALRRKLFAASYLPPGIHD